MKFLSYLKNQIKSLSYLGVDPSLSVLDIIRARIINVLCCMIVFMASYLFFYRLYLGDYEAVQVNLLLTIAVLLCLFLCYKGRHQSAVSLIAVFIVLLTLNLSNSNYHTSSIIYWASIPTAMAIITNKNILKHLFYIICVFLFTCQSIDKVEDINIFITFYCCVTIFYIGVFSFVVFVERKQSELDQVLIEKEDVIVKLKSRNKNLQQFSYICSHDFKEPIRNIGSYNSLIQRKLKKEKLKENYTEYFSFIDTGVNTLSNIVQTLKVFTEVNGKLKFEEEKINLNKFFEEVSLTLSDVVKEKNGAIIFENKSGTDHILSSNYGLKLIIQNLVLNGLNYNDSETPTVEVIIENDNEDIILKVKDNGIGIEAEYLKYIFQPFKTISSKSSHNSSGLGLAICKEIVNKIKGGIWAESIMGKGSTFFVRLGKVAS